MISLFLLDLANNKNHPHLGSRRNTFSQPIITDKGDGTHDVSYVPPPVGDPYEVDEKFIPRTALLSSRSKRLLEYPQHLSIPTSWPSCYEKIAPPIVILKIVHFSWHKAYFSSNPIEKNFSPSCPYAFLASELLSFIFAPNITHFKD